MGKNFCCSGNHVKELPILFVPYMSYVLTFVIINRIKLYIDFIIVVNQQTCFHFETVDKRTKEDSNHLEANLQTIIDL